MSEPLRLSFAGTGSLVMLGVVLLFVVMLGLIAVGLALVLVTRQLSGGGYALGALVLGAAAVAAGWGTLGQLQRFSTIVVESDGAWSMRNLVGIELMHLSADAPRAVDRHAGTATRLVGTMRKDPVRWLAIETPDGRVVESLRVPPARFDDTMHALDEWVEGRKNPR